MGVPTPKVYWLKNGAVLEPDTNIIISTEGHLLISQARFQDTANYTCVAENFAAKRFSDSVIVKVVGEFIFLKIFYCAKGEKEISNKKRGATGKKLEF